MDPLHLGASEFAVHWPDLGRQGQPSARPPHLRATGSVVHSADINSVLWHPLMTLRSPVEPRFALAAQGQPSVRPPHLRATGSVVHCADINSVLWHPLMTLRSPVEPRFASYLPEFERQGQGCS